MRNFEKAVANFEKTPDLSLALQPLAEEEAPGTGLKASKQELRKRAILRVLEGVISSDFGGHSEELKRAVLMGLVTYRGKVLSQYSKNEEDNSATDFHREKTVREVVRRFCRLSAIVGAKVALDALWENQKKPFNADHRQLGTKSFGDAMVTILEAKRTIRAKPMFVAVLVEKQGFAITARQVPRALNALRKGCSNIIVIRNGELRLARKWKTNWARVRHRLELSDLWHNTFSRRGPSTK